MNNMQKIKKKKTYTSLRRRNQYLTEYKSITTQVQ